LSAPATAAIALLCGLVFLFKPAQMFAANQPFFYFGFPQLATLLVPMFLAGFGLLAWLASRGGSRWQHALAAALGGIALAAWVNATFFPSPGGALDGRSLLIPLDEKREVLNALLCAAIALGGSAFAWWRPVLARRFLGALFAVLAAQTVWIGATDEHPWRAQGATHRLAQLSAEKNVLVILLDAFQSDFFGETLQREPALAQAFDGFTYFPNAVGPAPTTYLAMIAIHSGVPYREGARLQETYRRSVVERSFMARLAAAGYDGMLVNPTLNRCPDGIACDHEAVLVHGRARSLAEAALFLVDLAVFRIVPDAMKPAVYAEGSWMATRLLGERRGAFWFDAVTSNSVLELFAQSMRIESPRPVARFLHLFSTHSPASLDAECRQVRDLPWIRQTAIAQSRCALGKLTVLLRRLQALGIYDQTAIVVLADHGAGLRKDGGAWVWGAYASPLLLVKPYGERGELAHSTRVVGLTDVPASLCAWTRDCRMESGSDVMGAPAEPPRYPFFAYFWRHEYWLADAVPIFERYEVNGPPRDFASWRQLSNGGPRP